MIHCLPVTDGKPTRECLDIVEVKSIPYMPLSHPFVERLVGTVRRELLDHVPIWAARDIQDELTAFQNY